MTQQADVGTVPTWDLTDRLVKSLRFAGMGQQAMADYLGVSRNTIGNYTNAHTNPDKRTLMLWALRTGVPFEWLTEGTENPRPEGPDGGQEACTRRDSNPKPSDPKVRPLRTLQAAA